MWLASLTLLAACGSDGAVTDFCAAAQPILVSSRDVLTDETARRILALNELGAKRCGWQPGGR